MNCVEAKSLWESEPLETLEAERREHLDAHAEACASCRGEIALLEGIREELPALALPYRRRSLWILRTAAAAAAIVAVAFLYVLLSYPSLKDLTRDLTNHLAASGTFCRELEHLRGEDPQRDLRLVTAEWEASGLKQATRALPPKAVERGFGADAAGYVDTFRRVGQLIESGGSVREIQAVVKEGRAEEVAARLKPSFGPGFVQVTLPIGTDEVSRFATARACLYAGDTREAESLFDRFCAEFPKSAYASDAAYWGMQCAKDQGDTKTVIQFLSRITEEEWMDEQVVGEAVIVMDLPGLQMIPGGDGITLLSIVDEDPELSGPPSTMLYPLSLKLMEKAAAAKGLKFEIEQRSR